MKFAKYGLLIFFALGALLVRFAYSQTSPAPTPTPAIKLSEQLTQILQNYDRGAVSRAKREQAYAKLLEAQRSIYRMQTQRTQSGLAMFAGQGRGAILESLQYDPGLSECYVALVELTLITSSDLDEASSLSSLAIKLNKDSIGGHKFLARLLTRKSGLTGASIDWEIATKAIQEWNEVTRLDPRNAEGWALLSELYDRTGRSDDAIGALRKWVAASMPVDAGWFQRIVGGRPEELLPEQAPFHLASALSRAGRTREAVEVLVQQLSDDPNNADIMAQIQDVVGMAKPEAIAQAIEPIRQVVLSHPGSLTLLEFFAGLDAKAGNVDQAIAILRAAYEKLGVTDRPAAANLQITIGDIFSSRDRFSEAATAYEKALSTRGLDDAHVLDPDEKEFVMAVFDKLITAYRHSNRIDDAKSAIARARKLLGRDDIFADRQMISLYRETGDRDKALAVVRDARTRSPEDVTLLRLEATLLKENGNIDNAVELIKKRIASGENGSSTDRPISSLKVPRLDDDFSNYIFISQLYNSAGRGSDAALAASEAYQIAGSGERKQIALLMSATAKQTAGQFDEAESILRDILRTSPGNPIALNNLGYFLVQRGERLTEALDLIQRAIAIDPTNPSYLDSLGWVYLKLGKIDDAISRLEEAARLDDTSATIHEHLGDAYRQKGSLKQARSAWQRAAVLTTGAADTARIKEKLESAK